MAAGDQPRIPVFAPPCTLSLGRLTDVVRSGWWGYGPECRRLEEVFERAWGGWAIATSSGTEALHLAARTLRRRSSGDELGPGTEVIVPAITFVSTAMSFALAGHVVVVADVDADTLLLTSVSLEPGLTRNTVAIVAVDLYGRAAPSADLARLCTQRGLTLVEDRAHNIDLHRPPLGDFVCLSFNAVKEAPCGEGGLLWGRAEGVADEVRRLSYLGMDVDTRQRSAVAVHLGYEFTASMGSKSRLSDLQAALVLEGLDLLDQGRWKRAAIHAAIDAALEGSEWAPVPRMPDDSLLMYVARGPAESREELRARLAERHVSTSVHYPPLSDHPLFRARAAGCRQAELAAKEVVTLPCYASMTPGEVHTVVGALEEVAHRSQ